MDLKSISPLLAIAANTAWAMDHTVLQAMIDIFKMRAIGGASIQNEAIVRADRPTPRASTAAKSELQARGWERRGSIAVIPVTGVISKRASFIMDACPGTGTSTNRLRSAFSDARNSPGIKGAVWIIDSPGGSVAGIETISSDIYQARKAGFPSWSFADDLAASAGYWIGAQGEKFYGSEMPAVGSIGVYTPVVDSSKWYEKQGLTVHIVKAGARKAAGADGPPVSAEDLAAIQREIDGYYENFKAAVVRGRPQLKSKINDLADGTVKVGKAAVEAGLLDGLAKVETVIEAMNRKYG